MLSPYLYNSAVIAMFYSGNPLAREWALTAMRVARESLPNASARVFYKVPFKVQLFAVDVGRWPHELTLLLTDSGSRSMNTRMRSVAIPVGTSVVAPGLTAAVCLA